MEKERLVLLVSAVQNGSEEAFTALYEAFREDIYYHILKNVDNDSELAADLTQETFMEILQTIGELKEPVAFVTWSQRIAYHQCTAYFRKRRELLADEDADGYSVFDTMEEERTEFIPGEALEKEELKQAIRDIIEGLPAEQRSAIMLRYFNEVSVKEIADIQGVSEGTVKSRLNYGRKAIKDEVEKYEKKNNIKLHCAGVIPLLLWLLREYKRANNISLTASVPVAATEATVAAAGTTATAAATATTTAAGAGGAIAKTVVAIVAAAALTIGGIVGGTALLQSKAPAQNSAETETTTPTTSLFPEQPSSWYGYGEDRAQRVRRFDLVAEEMDEDHICGQLVVSYLYQEIHVTAFEGVGEEEDGVFRYDITFEVTAFDEYDFYEDYYKEIVAIYNPEEETLSFVSNAYDACMVRCDTADFPVLFTDETWAGIGEDDSDIGLHNKGHLFELEVYEMTEAELSGKLTVSKDGVVEHESEFTGRGYRTQTGMDYEIALETPRLQEFFGMEVNVDYFWFGYDMDNETFAFGSCLYSAEMVRQNENG